MRSPPPGEVELVSEARGSFSASWSINARTEELAAFRSQLGALLDGAATSATLVHLQAVFGASITLADGVGRADVFIGRPSAQLSLRDAYAGRALAWAVVADAVQPNDLVLVHAHGRIFYARVLGAAHLGRFQISPLDPAIRVRSVSLGDLRGHWSDQGDPRPAAQDAAQASFDHLLDR